MALLGKPHLHRLNQASSSPLESSQREAFNLFAVYLDNDSANENDFLLGCVSICQ